MVIIWRNDLMRGTYHTVGHDGDDDDPFKGRPGDKPDKKSPGKRDKN